MRRMTLGWGVLLICILTFIMGCGKTDGKNGSKGIEDTTDRVVNVTESGNSSSWSVSHTALDASFELATINNDKIYGCYYTENGITVSVFDCKTGEKLNAYEIPDVSEIQNITVDSQSRIALFGLTEKGYALWQVEQDGEISVMGDIDVEDLGIFPSLKAFFVDSKGLYYLWYEMSVPCAEVYENGEKDIYTVLDRIYVKDRQMKTICYEQIPDSYGNKLLSLLFDENGSPMLLAQDMDGYYTRKVRTEVREEYEQYRIEETKLSEQGLGNHIALTNNGLLYTRDGALYLYHMEEKKEKELLDISGGGIYEEDIVYLGIREGKIEVVDNYLGSGNAEYTSFTPGESKQVQLTIAVMEMQPDMRRVITEFNRSQDYIQIKPIAYVEGTDYDAGYEKLKLDVVQGKAPDIISTYGIDYESLANKGVFVNLYEYMEADPECAKEMFVPGVLKAYETEGRLYTVAPSFLIHTMWGRSSLVQGRHGVDMNELIQILKENGGDINNIYGFSADESVLRTLCSLGMSQFINWEDGICDFANEEFYQILEFAKEYRGTPFESLYLATRENQILLTLGLITSVEDYCLESELYGEDVDFVGYPTTEGNGTVASFLGDAWAVNAKSGYLQEAWEFIKYYLLHGYDGSGFPIMQDQFEEVLLASIEEILTEEDGQTARVAKKTYTERDVVSIQIYKAEQKDIDAVKQLVERVTGKFQYYNTIQNIIDEEAEYYFSGHKNLQAVAEVIQNRVRLYLQESR